LSQDKFKPVLDWSSYRDAGMGDAYADIPKNGGNFAKAVAVCINSHQCETLAKGVMCPSYRVLQQASASTGGRVRLLKAALNGELGAVPFRHAGLATAMELCVGCKGCKRECENEVDMAMIKVEYLAQQLAQSGTSLRTRMLANLSRYLSLQGFRNLLVLRNRMPLLAKMTERLFGLSAQRKLPEPVATPYLQRPVVFQRTQVSTDVITTPRTEVVLLIDTFTNHFAPENAEAAIAVLTRAGYRVLTTQTNADRDRPLCCGRTHIAHGLVDKARAEAKRMLSVLLPHVEAGRSIIGLEPACLLAIRDDYKFLGLGEAATKVASQAILFEEFIAKEITAKRFGLTFKPLNSVEQPLLVHGHCHQKAVGAMKSLRKVLKLIPQLKFEFIESTCCGVAGSFGIEKEHAEVAMQMAEQALLPALRQQPQARILANGFSCRHQIKEGVKRDAKHLALLLHEAMA